MINKSIQLIVLGIVLCVTTRAQSISDGIKTLYDGKIAGAKAIFQKEANKPEAIYWMVQAELLDDDKNAEQQKTAAHKVLDNALAAKANDPWLLTAKGHLELLDKKSNEATQSFESAITASKGKKGDDPEILNAIGRAITRVYNNVDKVGDIEYAVQKLEAAVVAAEKSKSEWLKADIYSNLGDAYRKAKPGDGTAAFTAFQNANTADPTYANAFYRNAFIFKSQKNYELYQRNLEQAVEADPQFLPAYEELYAYKLSTLDNNGAQEIADKIIANSDPNPNNDYYKATTQFLNKQFDEAIATGNGIVQNAGENANPRVYKLLAYSNLEKKDTAAALPFVDKYFAKVSKDKIVAGDYNLKAMALSNTPGKEKEIYQAYMDGLAMDTILADRVKLLEDGAKFFDAKKQFIVAGDLLSKLIEIKPEPTINDYFSAGYRGYYQGNEYEKSWKVFDAMRTKFPNVNYGYLWTYNNSKIFDSTNAKNTMVPDAEKLIAFSKTDTAQDAKINLYRASYGLAVYYNDQKKDKVNGLKYLNIAAENAPSPELKTQLEGVIKQLGGVTPLKTQNDSMDTNDKSSPTPPTGSKDSLRSDNDDNISN